MIAYAVILAIGFKGGGYWLTCAKDLKIGMCIYGSYVYGEYIFIFFVLLCCVIQQMHLLFNLYIHSPSRFKDDVMYDC
uniref:Uncharacterized protein n=1 Tax=Kalanchoe fedtschenkoi TaxID=63787 RepID=A0A7N0UTI6_KALFE